MGGWNCRPVLDKHCLYMLDCLECLHPSRTCRNDDAGEICIVICDIVIHKNLFCMTRVWKKL